jgi:hypothetical protein
MPALQMNRYRPLNVLAWVLPHARQSLDAILVYKITNFVLSITSRQSLASKDVRTGAFGPSSWGRWDLWCRTGTDVMNQCGQAPLAVVTTEV